MFDANGNNQYGGLYYNPQGMVQYAQKQPSTLTPEEYERLSTKDNPFSLTLTMTEQLRGICNHRTIEGDMDTLETLPDGTVRCKLCGYQFNPIDTNTSTEDIQEACDLIVDMLQTIKLLYVDMPTTASREYFQIIPLIEKIPQLFQIAAANYAKYENYSPWAQRGQNMNTLNLFNMMNSGQPMNFGQPMMYQQPMGNPAYGYGMVQNPAAMNAPVGAMAPNTNGFVMNNPMPGQPPVMGYAPTTNGYQYNPMQQPQQVMNVPPVANQPGTTAPVEQTATTDGATVNATANFKA